MKVLHQRSLGCLLLASALLQLPAAQAGVGDLLNQAGSATGLSLPSTTSSSTGNVAGILEFCVKNNYLNADSASGVKDQLMSKLGGSSSAASDSGYSDGAQGILKSSNGQEVDLSGSSLKEKVTKQVCDKILEQGKSML